MVSDGHLLRQSWSSALNDALASFRGHLTSGQSSSWKRVVATKENGVANKVKAPGCIQPEASDIIVHRKITKSGEIFRAVLDVPVDDDLSDLEAWNAVLVTPELRQEWDPAVESSHLIEMFDPATRIVKTKFTLGWPANPRDAVMISRTFSDATTVIDISTSLPRSPDEPAYLRPSPPYVRSHVNLFAWCMQLIYPPMQISTPGDEPTRKNSDNARLRMTCFWQHDLRAAWNFGNAPSPSQQLQATVLGLLATVRKRFSRVTVLTGYGNSVSIERVTFDIGRESMVVDYVIIPEDQGNPTQLSEALHGLDELHTIKEQRRLERSIECLLPSTEGWDIRISTRASSEAVAQLPWSAHATRISPPKSDSAEKQASKVTLQVKHAALIDDHSVLKVKIIIELSGGSKGIRLNGLPHPIEERQIRDPLSFSMSNQLIQDASGAIDMSFHTGSSVASVHSDASNSSASRRPTLLRSDSAAQRSPAGHKSILARVRRNYIYFSSLLQEPEAKWKRNTEVRGVSVTQLDSIDPTLVVYRAEATFVGVGLWDLYSAVITPGARVYWDKQFEDATLLEDVNELTELWHYKTRPAWPVNGRDAVLLKTVYKSPTTVHVFSFSVDDPHLFPDIPSADLSVIRTQVDLQGWAIEALSPTTTLITLLEQSDPKGWSGKSSIPQQMISSVAGVGEFVIKCGGPPIVTRLAGAKANAIRYEHDRGNFRIEYEGVESRRVPPADPTVSRSGRVSNTAESSNGVAFNDAMVSHRASNSAIECEFRCDIDTWASSLDIVIDPPPQTISCLRRHRLSNGGGGVWLTVGHDAVYTKDDRLLAIIRKAPLTLGKEKGIVMVNGRKINVDVEELPDSEVKSLSKQKRIKPIRVPLDQPPVLGSIRKRRAEWGVGGDQSVETKASGPSADAKSASSGWKSSAPKVPSPLTNFFTMALEQATSTTQQAVAALTPSTTVIGSDSPFPPSKLPMQHALEALAFVQGYHKGSYRDNWNLVTDKGLPVHRRFSPEVSPMIPVHKGEKVIESVTAEEVASVISNHDCRKHWDDRFDSATVFEEFGADARTAFVVNKGGFPFRDRGFYLAFLTARDFNNTRTPALLPDVVQNTGGNPTVIYCVAASFNPEYAAAYAPSKYNPYGLPVGRMFLDAWILETLDPYTTENFAIPSTRCTRVAAVDYAGSIPGTVNTMINSAFPKSIMALETYLKGLSPPPAMKLPVSGLLVDVGEDSDARNEAWSLRQNDPRRIMLSTRYRTELKAFHASLLISLVEPPANQFDVDTPRPEQADIDSRPGSPDVARRTRAVSIPSSPSLTPRHRRISTSTTASPSGSMAMRSRSREPFRPTPSIFSLTKEYKLQGPDDFVVAEIAIDAKSYPSGYDVRLSSQIQECPSGMPAALSQLTGEAAFPPPTDKALPFACAVHTIPSSPLHSSGLNVEQLPRYLLRLTLPTALYQVPTIVDPLTGETRTAPPKPVWYKDLEDKDKRAVVDVEIRPLEGSSVKRGKVPIMIDGIAIAVSGEKDSFKGGISDSADDVERVAVISRVPLVDGADPLPEELSKPLAVAKYLFVQAITSSGTLATSPNETPLGDKLGHDTEESDKEAVASSPEELTNVDENAFTSKTENNGRLLNFLSTYTNPLSRFIGPSSAPSAGILSTNSKLHSPSITAQISSLSAETAVSTVSSLGESVVRAATAPHYSLSSLVLVALIGFLLGSLLRSLLSPADFIYVVNDINDTPGGLTGQSNGGLGTVEPGWREIKRLLEVKYIVGGWDFQVAVVRRH